MDDNANENARPGDESGRAQGSAMEMKSTRSFEVNDATWSHSRKPSLQPYIDAGLQLIPLHKWDAKDAKQRPRGKTPRDGAWQVREYDSDAVADAADRDGINVGVRLPASVMVLDVDPRNFGDDDSLLALMIDTGMDLRGVPQTATGSGGSHYWFSKPIDVQLLDSLEKYPGVEFKSFGRQVVSAGSRHPNGVVYAWVGNMPNLRGLPDMPASLLELTRRPIRSHGEAAGLGELTPDMLAETLEQLDPTKFSDHDAWLNLMMASHHATNGEGRQEFIDWSTGDATYADDAWVIGRRWDSLHAEAGRGGRPITIKYLHKVVQEHGGQVAQVAAEDDFEPVDMADFPVTPKQKRWHFLTLEQLEALPPPKWLVDGVIQEDTIVAIYGPPESFKSFLAIDLVMSVASNRTWHGRDVVAGAVLYIAAEGALGLTKRAKAWKAEHGVGSVPFHLMHNDLNLAQEKEAAEFCRQMTAELGPLRMIVVDTLNQTATGADENSAQDMGRYVKSMKRMRDETGATVVVVHHSGKDATKGMRGSTALLGGMDTTIEVIRPDEEGMAINVKVKKQKDGEKERPMQFSMTKIADSLVLRPTLETVKGTVESFIGTPLRDWVAKEVLERGGRMAFKDLVNARVELTGGKDRMTRMNLQAVLAEGEGHATQSSDGTRVWMERKGGNSRGELEVVAVAGAEQ
jgi:hypothetical protein